MELGEGDENFAFINIWNMHGGFDEQHIVYSLLLIYVACNLNFICSKANDYFEDVDHLDLHPIRYRSSQ